MPRRNYASARTVLRGRGGYFADRLADFKAGRLLPKGLGRAIGRGISMFHPAGGAIGSALQTAQDALKTYTGLGAYRVNQNTLVNEGQDVPYMHSAKGITRITHREYVGDLQTPGPGYSIQMALALDVCNQATFPWLSQVANGYQCWKLAGCVVYFKSYSADSLNSTNTALGEVIMSTLVDPHFPTPGNKFDQLQCQYTVSSKPSESLAHVIECKPATGAGVGEWHFCSRRGSYDRTADPSRYSYGTTYVATSGCQAASVLGEIWISYDVLLSMPRSDVATDPLSYHARLSGLTVTNTALLGLGNGDGTDIQLLLDNNSQFPIGSVETDSTDIGTMQYPAVAYGSSLHIILFDKSAQGARIYFGPSVPIGTYRIEWLYHVNTGTAVWGTPTMSYGANVLAHVTTSATGAVAGGLRVQRGATGTGSFGYAAPDAAATLPAGTVLHDLYFQLDVDLTANDGQGTGGVCWVQMSNATFTNAFPVNADTCDLLVYQVPRAQF